MTRPRVLSYTISVDGSGAGPRQALDQPMGERGGDLHPRLMATRTFARMHGGTGGTITRTP